MASAPVELAEGLWLLGHHHYNLYLVRGGRGTALYEVGVSGMVDEAVRQLESLDARPDYLIVSHTHADHLTGLSALRDRFPRAEVVVGRWAAEFAAHPKAGPVLVAEDRHMSEVLEAEGHRPGRPPLDASPTLEGSRIAREGDVIDLGGLTLEFLEAAGHAPGHLVAHVPERKAVLLSDALGFRLPGRWFWPMAFTGVADYLSTLGRVEALGGEVLGLGHQGPVGGAAAAAAFENARADLEAFARLALDEEQPPEDLAAALFDRFYRDELVINSESNIRNCMKLLIRRFREAAPARAEGADRAHS